MVQRDDLKLKMAEHCYGYGRWDAPYWFLGPEQGMSTDENELNRRAIAWAKRNELDLDDAKDFHVEIGEPRWHGLYPLKRALLQSTWKQLMLVALSFAGEGVSTDDRRKYQASSWGRVSGKTCVIELSGLAAHSQRVARNIEIFLPQRLKYIDSKLKKDPPKFVVLYGKGRDGSSERAWNELTNGAERVEAHSFSFATIKRRETTLFAWAPHPRGQTNQNWIELGIKLKNLVKAD